MRQSRLAIVLVAILIHFTQSESSNSEESVQEPSIWQEAARREFDQFQSSPLYGRLYNETIPPKSVILFIGDGMSLSTVTGARYMKASLQNKSTGDVQLTWDSWPTVSLVRTFSADRMTTDSAASATAMFSGSKVKQNVLGVSHLNTCCKCNPFNESQKLNSAFIHAQLAGLSTGIVTNMRITHATPAGTYAHTANRKDEYVSRTSKTNKDFVCEDIASQLISKGINLNVILGGGSANFYQHPDELTPNRKGKRVDGRNLFREWKLEQKRRNRSHLLVTDAANFTKLNFSNVDYLFGLLSRSTTPYDIKRTDEPSLTEMTEAALQVLTRNPKGYLLLVEGGRIDYGHHSNRAKLALTETLALEKAVEMAVERTNSDDTLIVVTADHSHAYGVVGYSPRTESVLDLAQNTSPLDKLPMLISTYFNGPGASIKVSRADPTHGNLSSNDYAQQSLVPLKVSTHAADDVPLYATGPLSELFHRPMDNTFIAHATMFTLCIGPYVDESHCQHDDNDSGDGFTKSWHLMSGNNHETGRSASSDFWSNVRTDVLLMSSAVVCYLSSWL